MLGEPDSQLSLTHAALSTGRHAKANSVSNMLRSLVGYVFIMACAIAGKVFCARVEPMSFLCRCGFHKWNGCTCGLCAKSRNQEHEWSKDCEQCSRCGRARSGAHAWDGCKCSTCGKTRRHVWLGCKCSQCGTTRDEGHDWSEDCRQCEKCGKSRPGGHDWNGCRCAVCDRIRDPVDGWNESCCAWDGCKCSKCFRSRDKEHDWSANCSQCAKCGKARPCGHQWRGCICAVCGLTRDEEHDWKQDCEKCAKCSKTRQNAHRWSGCKCAACGRTRDEEHDWKQDPKKCAKCGKTRHDRATSAYPIMTDGQIIQEAIGKLYSADVKEATAILQQSSSPAVRELARRCAGTKLADNSAWMFREELERLLRGGGFSRDERGRYS